MRVNALSPIKSFLTMTLKESKYSLILATLFMLLCIYTSFTAYDTERAWVMAASSFRNPEATRTFLDFGPNLLALILLICAFGVVGKDFVFARIIRNIVNGTALIILIIILGFIIQATARFGPWGGPDAVF